MNKLMRLALMAGTSLLAMACPASAEPISIGLVTALGFTAGTAAFSIAVAVSNFVISTALSVGASVLTRKKTKKQKPVGGVEASADFGVETYRKIMIGKGPTTGRLVYLKGEGASNSRYHFVWHVGDWTYESLDSIIYNGERKTLTSIPVVGTENARFTVDGYNGKFVLKFFRGSFPQAADSEIIAASADTQGQSIGPWDATYRGDGCCLVTGYFDYDETLFQQGIDTKPVFECKGAKLYDRRKDSTAGGFGAHRYSDPDTWEYSENPAVAAEVYERGFYGNGQLILGKGSFASELLGNHYVAAMNICDEIMPDGGKRYACAILGTSESEHTTFLDACSTAMSGEWVEASGMSGPYAGAAYSVVATITDDDLLADMEGVPFPFRFSKDTDTIYNSVSCKFINPAINWQSDDLVLLENPTWKAEDGGRNLPPLALDLQSVPYISQAARIQKIAHEQSRMTASCSGTYHRKHNVLEVGDWVTRVFNRKGHGTYTMKVAARQQLDDGNVSLTLRQCASANFVPPVTGPVIAPPFTNTPPQLVSTLLGFTLAADTIDTSGQVRPSLLVTWFAPNDPSVQAVQIEYRLLNNAVSLRTERVTSPNDGAKALLADILARTVYQARIRPEYRWGGVGIWTAWLEVETTTQFSVTSAMIAHDTQDTLMRVLQYSSAPDLLSGMLGEWYRYQNDWDVATQSSTETMRVSNTANTAFASIEEFKIVYVNDQAAFAAALTAVEATANGSTAGGLMKFEAESSPAGAAARIILSTRVATSGGAGLSTFNQAGMVMETKLVSPGVYKSSVAFLADSFSIVTNSTTGVSMVPFSVISGEVYINSLIMGGTLRSANFVTGQSGWAVFQNGTAEFQKGIFGGITSSKEPFELSYGTAQDGIFSDEATGTIKTSVAVSGGTIAIVANIKRTPTSVDYDIDTTFNGAQPVNTKKSVPKSSEIAWAPMLAIVTTNNTTIASLRFNAIGELFAETISGGVTSTKVLDCLSPIDLDLMQRLPMNSTDYLVFKSRVIGGIKRFRIRETVNVSGTPTAVVGIRVWMWGSAGTGAGGFVKFDLAVVAGQMFWVIVGDHEDDGFGAQGHAGNIGASSITLNGSRGGGGSFFGIGKVSRPNTLAAAGGGGCHEGNTTRGGAGGSSTSGQNGSSATDMTRCMGVNGGSVGGGGGYEGGGTFVSGNTYSRGGTNYVTSSAINVTSAAGSESGGNWTSGIPGSGEAVYTTYKANDQGRPDVAVPGNHPASNVDITIGGPGMVIIQYLTSI